jgi:uncharacterized protein (DUF2252 family)
MRDGRARRDATRLPNDSRIEDATRAYEAWMGRYTRIVRADLALKHEHMRSDPFHFLRTTFYRWQQCWPSICQTAIHAPVVLAVADLHIENFGTWRDQEGRLIWGVNDFDEACPLPVGRRSRLTDGAEFARAGERGQGS